MNRHRETIIHVLQLFASKSEQFELYWDEEEKIFIPDVLRGRWEEAYWPDSRKFEEGFLETELQALDTFRRFFLSRMNLLPHGNFRNLMTDVYWDSICRLADETLALLSENEALE